MQRSYLVKSPVHFADLGFFVKVGDILVHDTSNSNRLTVYRNGEVVKTVQQTALGIAAMQKSGFIQEVTQAPRTAPKPSQKPPEPPKPSPKREDPKPAAKPAPAPPKREEAERKRAKAVPVEVPFEELPQHLKDVVEAKEAKAKKPEIKDETV